MAVRLTAAVAVAAGAMVAVVAGCDLQPKQPEGRKLYKQFCVDCHGPKGKGDGPAAASLPKKPADLTQIAARNGGVFPTVRVMSTIDGYTRVQQGKTVMPELGPALQASPTVMYDAGDGVATPTPLALVELAEYLRSIQEK